MPVLNSEPTDDPTVQVARNLRAIVELSADLEDQAVNKATDRELPGGDAMVYLSPVANLEAWGNVVDGAERWNDNHEPRQHIDLTHVDDEHESYEPPLQTLLYWSEAWRVEHGAESDMRPTVATEAGFLARLLQWAYDNEPHWDDFAADVHAARTRIEATLKAGERAERSKTPCMDCEGVRLVKRYSWRGVDYDYHKCPRCNARYENDRLLRAQHQELASAGADRFIWVREAIGAIPRSERTIREWLGQCRTICDVRTHRVLVWWPDLRDLEREAMIRDASRKPYRSRHVAACD